MQNVYDLKRYAVLYVDDEELALKYFEKTFGREFRILTATNAADGLKIIEERGDEIGVLITDQRMPGEKGVQLLERARLLRPRLVRMLITAYADFGVTVDAVNIGNVFRYVSKPLQVEDMRNTLGRAMEFFLVQQERDDLLKEKLSVLQNMLITDRVISLGVLAAGLNTHLRNPLQAVKLFMELTPGTLRQEGVSMERLRDPAFWRDYHGLVVKQASRIADMLGEINESTTALGSEEMIDPEAIINQSIEQHRNEFRTAGIEFRSELAGSLPMLRADPRKFRKMFDMLFRCELSVQSPRSRASITVQPVQLGAQAVSLLIAFNDNGPGLPAEALRSVFDPFLAAAEKSQEFGLNLMGLYLLVCHHGGRIHTKSSSGDGLNFVIDIPATPVYNVPSTTASREFVTGVLMNDALWERLLPSS